MEKPKRDALTHALDRINSAKELLAELKYSDAMPIMHLIGDAEETISEIRDGDRQPTPAAELLAAQRKEASLTAEAPTPPSMLWAFVDPMPTYRGVYRAGGRQSYLVQQTPNGLWWDALAESPNGHPQHLGYWSTADAARKYCENLDDIPVVTRPSPMAAESEAHVGKSGDDHGIEVSPEKFVANPGDRKTGTLIVEPVKVRLSGGFFVSTLYNGQTQIVGLTNWQAGKLVEWFVAARSAAPQKPRRED